MPTCPSTGIVSAASLIDSECSLLVFSTGFLIISRGSGRISQCYKKGQKQFISRQIWTGTHLADFRRQAHLQLPPTVKGGNFGELAVRSCVWQKLVRLSPLSMNPIVSTGTDFRESLSNFFELISFFDLQFKVARLPRRPRPATALNGLSMLPSTNYLRFRSHKGISLGIGGCSDLYHLTGWLPQLGLETWTLRVADERPTIAPPRVRHTSVLSIR